MRRAPPSLLAIAALAACGPAGTTTGRLSERARPPRTEKLDAGQVAPPPPEDELVPEPPPAEDDAGFAPDAEAPRPDAAPLPPPADAGAPVPPVPDFCAQGPNKPRPTTHSIYYGTDQPQHVPLAPQQVSAIGNFGGCSGAFIAPSWILSATHCGLRRGASFCIGQDPTSEDACFTATRVVDNPNGDMTLLEIGEDATARAPWMAPVPILAEGMDRSWIGRTVEAAGYGQQETGRGGRREFTAEPISQVGGDTVTIDGQGRHGVCFGDSGGPLFAVGADGTPRVAGTLSNGDSSCVGFDNFTRTDVYRAWIEGYVGASPPATPDACGGLTFAGRCSGNTLEWCEAGARLSRDCQACGETCLPARDGSGSFCIPSDCGDLTFQGRCEGNTAVWCNRDGHRETRACTRGCAFVDEDTGYYCR